MKAIEQYFLEEMRSLHQDAQVFSEDFPEQAAMLNLKELRDKDPYVERLLEGVAYLTAQVRQQIDHCQAQIGETLLEQLCPELLRPIPALTIIEFKPKINSQRTQLRLPKGLELLNQRQESMSNSIGFSICDELIIYPMHLKYCSATAHELQLTFQTLPHTDFAQLALSEFSLYLHAESLVALELFMLLTQYVESIQVEYTKQNKTQELPVGVTIKPFSAEQIDRLLPNTGRTCMGIGIIQDYFALREKYLSVKFSGLEKLLFPDDQVQEIKFQIYFTSKSKVPDGLTVDNFKLHCIPAVNLLRTHSEPIIYNNHQLDYSLIADYIQPDNMIYDIAEVSAYDQDKQKKTIIEPFYKLTKSFLNHPCYQIARHDYSESRSNIKLNFINMQGHKSLSLEAEVLVFQGNKPRKYLQEGSINQIQGECSLRVDAKNLLRPTAVLLPPTNVQYQQQLLGLLQNSICQINTQENLCRLLQQFDWSNRRENHQRIEGIKFVEVLAIEKFINGGLVSGWRWNIQLGSQHYASEADAYHFGYFLYVVLLTYNNLHEVLETKIVLDPQQQEWLWQE